MAALLRCRYLGYDVPMATVFSRHPRFAWWALFTLVLAFALTLRLWGLNGDEVRTDEGNYALRAIGWNDFMFSTALGTPWVWFQELPQVPAWTLLSFNDHPPLHFGSIWLAAKAFGIHLWAVRLPSALYGGGAVAVLMLLLRRFGYRGSSLAAGALLAVLPWHIFISRQAIQESGVIFWILLTLLFAAQASSAVDGPRSGWRWAAVGLALAGGLLTKYSAAVVLLPLVWLTLRCSWYRRAGFWWAPGVLAALLSPLVYYNWRVYLLRGHFDLQLSRLLMQDTSQDWPASHQAIWQGDWKQLITFSANQARGLTWPAAAVAAAGMLWGWRRGARFASGVLASSVGAAAVGAVLALITLNDYGRSAVLLPFYLLTFGVGLAQLPGRLQWPLTTVALAVAAAASLPAFAGSTVLPRLAQTFWQPPVGFAEWETWRAANLPSRISPRHYTSLLDWLERQIADAARPEREFVVVDNRITWFPSNWYFFRYGWYADDVTFVNAGLFAYLNWQNVFEPQRGRPLMYIEAGPAAFDSKGTFDEQTRVTHLFFETLVKRQKVAPRVVTASNGQPLVKIWRVVWERELNFPPATAVGTRP